MIFVALLIVRLCSNDSTDGREVPMILDNLFTMRCSFLRE